MKFNFFNKDFSIAKFVITGFCILFILISSNICSAQTEEKQTQPESKTFFFSYMLKSRLNPEFKLCVPITEEFPFQIEWVDQEIKSTLTIILKKAVEGKYPVRVTVTEGTKENTTYSGMEEPKLQLDKPYKSMFVASSLFKDTYEQNMNLSKTGCNFTEGSNFF